MIEKDKLPVNCKEVLEYLTSVYPIEDGRVLIGRFALEQVENNVPLSYDRSCSAIGSLIQFKLADFASDVRGETFWEKLTGEL